MTPDNAKVEAALAVLAELVRRFDATIPTPISHRGESTMRIEHFVDLSFESKQALATLTAALSERERDAGRYRHLFDCPEPFCYRGDIYTDKQSADAAIDAAMQGESHD